jgi:dihydroxyacetone kinase-like protein
VTDSLRARILAACAAIEASRDELCRLDAVAGDGDHGVSMALGTRAIRKVLEANPDATGAALIALLAPAAGSVGGAIGPLWAVMLVRLAGTARDRDRNGEPPSTADLAAYAAAALSGAQALGHASPGDKTLVDALAPAVDALSAAESQGLDPETAARGAVDAARAGAEGTAAMVATLGRSSRLGERSRGSPDPGATSFAIVLESLLAVSEDERERTGT